MKAEIWHNPSCSKSREALALLRESGIEPTVVLYLDATPSAARIEEVLRLLNVEPRSLMRTKEPEYAALGLADPALSREALVAAMVRTPRLIERPVVITSKGAVIGRPPERLKELL